jgi:hypothetical protein
MRAVTEASGNLVARRAASSMAELWTFNPQGRHFRLLRAVAESRPDYRLPVPPNHIEYLQVRSHVTDGNAIKRAAAGPNPRYTFKSSHGLEHPSRHGAAHGHDASAAQTSRRPRYIRQRPAEAPPPTAACGELSATLISTRVYSFADVSALIEPRQ